jgi:hypothetical protein
MPKNQRNAPTMMSAAIPQNEPLLTALTAPMNANAPTTKHQTGIGSIMIEFFSTKIFRVYAHHLPSGNQKRVIIGFCPIKQSSISPIVCFHQSNQDSCAHFIRSQGASRWLSLWIK